MDEYHRLNSVLELIREKLPDQALAIQRTTNIAGELNWGLIVNNDWQTCGSFDAVYNYLNGMLTGIHLYRFKHAPALH